MLAGVELAYVAVRVLLRYGASQLPRLETVPFDTPVLLFAIAMLVVCALGVGFAPVLQLSGTGMERWLRERGRTVVGTRSTHRALRMMIIAEVAVAVTIVAGTGLLVRSFVNLQRNDPGLRQPRASDVRRVAACPAYRDPGVRHAWTANAVHRSSQRSRGSPPSPAHPTFRCGPDNGGTGRSFSWMTGRNRTSTSWPGCAW